MKRAILPILFGIVMTVSVIPGFAESMDSVYLLDGIVMTVDPPYYFEAEPEEQEYFTLTDYDGHAVDVVVLYRDDYDVPDPLDAMMLFLRRTNIEYFTRMFLAENGETYALFPDPDRKDLQGYIMFAGSIPDGGENGFFVYGVDLQGSPGGSAQAVMLISYPGYGDEVLQDIIRHFHITVQQAAG